MKRSLLCLVGALAILGITGTAQASLEESCHSIGLEKDKTGLLCYPPCKEGYKGVGPVCWQNCPGGYTDDGATCRRNAKIVKADNSKCPWYDKCGLTLKKGCSTCPDGMKNDGCTCRQDVHIFAKQTETRGAGKPIPEILDGIKNIFLKVVKAAWAAAKKISCSGLMDKLFAKGMVNKTDTKKWNVGHYFGACGQEFTKGLICSIPDIFTEVFHLAQDAFEAAWKNRKICFTVGLLGGFLMQGPTPGIMIGPLMCGLGFYLIDKVPKAISCLIETLKGNTAGAGKAWGAIATELGCNILGSLVVDVIIAIITGGAAGPAVIGKQIGKMTASISAKLPASIVQNVAKFAKITDALSKLATAYTQLESNSACQLK
jgi:hypothetical protein